MAAVFAALVLAALAGGCGSGSRRADGGAAGAPGADAGAGGRDAAGGAAESGAAGSGFAGSGGATFTADGGTFPCDTNGDGLEEAPSCVTSPVTLRFVNATAGETFDVWLAGAAVPVAAALGPYAVTTVGPVQTQVIDCAFRRSGGPPVTGTVSRLGAATTIVVYQDPTASVPTFAIASAAERPTGACGANSAEVDFGELTSLTPAPVVVFYATGADWTPVLSPGLAVGQIFGSGCWNGGASVELGAGPVGATTPADIYQATSFAPLATYQVLMTDDRLIEIDDLNQVTYVPRRGAAPVDAGSGDR